MDLAFKGLKGFAAEAATALNRAVQFTEEQLGHSERTELDGYFENLLSRAEQIKSWTEKIVASAESVLQPNPGTRVEDYIIEKLAVAEKRKERLRNLEWLGSNMIAAGQDFTPGDNYGSALIKCGQVQLKLGQIEREFSSKADKEFVKPLKKFLDEDAKALVKEKRTLEAKRLDLDATKNKFKKVRSPAQAQASHADNELSKAQKEFDLQVEVVANLCNKIIASNEQHVRYLSRFIDAQAEYYNQASQQLMNLVRENSDDPNVGNSTGFAKFASLSEARPEGERS